MEMPDVNLLVYAHRAEMELHRPAMEWLNRRAAGPEPFALSEPVMQGFIRLVTNARFFQPRSSMEDALRFLDSLLGLPHCVRIRPGARHWEIFRRLCREVNAKGPLVADAAHAAVAIESGCEWITFDTDFARFAPPLRWRRLPD